MCIPHRFRFKESTLYFIDLPGPSDRLNFNYDASGAQMARYGAGGDEMSNWRDNLGEAASAVAAIVFEKVKTRAFCISVFQSVANQA